MYSPQPVDSKIIDEWINIDTSVEYESINPYIFGASVIGPSHIQKNMPRQDALAYDILNSNFGIIAVADGLGSASMSDLGAQLAVEKVIEGTEKGIEKFKTDISNVAGYAAKYARKELEKKAIEEKYNLRDLACTLIVLVIHNNVVSVAHIGDGAVVAKINDDIKLLSGPEESEYINEVVPLTSKDWEKSLRVTPKIFGVSHIAVFTDGCQRAVLVKSRTGLQPYKKFFEPLFSDTQEIKDKEERDKEIRDFLSSKKMSESSEDDKTFVVAVLK